ncbi:MAG: response regulator [Actinobacteria bacterium]|nr:response regulator [Actinomycetota bacterium]
MDIGPEKVMVVDDEPGVRYFLRRAVTALGLEVVERETADEALAELLTGGFAVALVDIQMPGRDGRWLLDRMVESGSDVSVVMVTGQGDVRTAVDCLTRGAINYVTKPFDPEELGQVVNRALMDRRLRLENRAYREDLERLVAQRTAQLEGALDDVREANLAREAAYRETIYRLSAAAEYRDEETGNHIRRIGLYSRVLAEGLDADQEFVDLILLASPMHDIGKIGIRDSILLKPGRLTPEEFDEMRAHTTIGAGILAESSSQLMQLAEIIALTHHERYAGGGYPAGLSGERIPLAGRIVALADVFDALTSNRVYKSAYPVDKSLHIIRNESPGHFDPAVVYSFESGLDRILAIRDEFEDPESAGGLRGASRLESEVLPALRDLEERSLSD